MMMEMIYVLCMFTNCSTQFFFWIILITLQFHSHGESICASCTLVNTTNLVMFMLSYR